MNRCVTCGHNFYDGNPFADGRCKYCHEENSQEFKAVIGQLHTSIKCPHCGKNQIFTGDYRNTIIHCPICDKRIEII